MESIRQKNKTEFNGNGSKNEDRHVCLLQAKYNSGIKMRHVLFLLCFSSVPLYIYNGIYISQHIYRKKDLKNTLAQQIEFAAESNPTEY